MTPQRRKQAYWLIGILLVANIIYYYYSNWGLITVKVHDAPLGKVIKSIEWQGWVKIYTNLDPTSKVSMYVDHVPLAEAMETLAVNVDLPPRPPRQDGGAPRANRPDGTNFGAPPAGGGPPGGGGGNFAGPPGGAPPADGAGGPPGGGGRRGGGGLGGGGFGGGGGGGAQWNLAFFVGPRSADVKSEILSFEQDTPDPDSKIYTYPTPLQMVASDEDMPASDPRQQAWPGVKADPPPAPAPAATPDPAAATAPAPADPFAPPTAAAAPAEPATKNAQDYFKSFAQSANIWIMAPGSWTPDVNTPPPPNSSIISAVKSFVGHIHGSVTEAIILRARWNGNAGRGGFAGAGGIDDMADRMRNAINGLPPDARGDALAQLDQEVAFYKDLQTAPPDQRRQRFMAHMMSKMVDNLDNPRRSPEKRAQRYARLVAARIAATGK